MEEREIKFEIKLIARESVNGYEKGQTVTIINDIFDKKNGVAFFQIDKNFDIVYKRQYTGLKDNNGKEIYEGDIVRCGTVGEIKFLNGRFIYDYSHPEDPEQLDVFEIVNGEIIGNIYEIQE